MKILLLTLALSFASQGRQAPVHLDLETSGLEFRGLIHSGQIPLEPVNLNRLHLSNSWKPDEVIAVGERLYKWLEFENNHRPIDKKLRFTSPSTRTPIPITNPKRYGLARLDNDFTNVLAGLPQGMKDVLLSNDPFPAALPVTDDEFVVQGRLVDRQYQTAARWKMLIPYRLQYMQARAYDVRGYYFLTAEAWDENKLAAWESLAVADQTRVKEYFVGICMNDGVAEKTCLAQVNSITTGAQAVDHFKKYMAPAQRVFRSFFEISNNRKDIDWKSNTPMLATIPFVDPKDGAIQNYLVKNIEAEYSWGGWNLRLKFVPNGPAPYVEFIPGITPNVSGLGGNRIQMDANQNIAEYEVGWIIRHEFGHVLGFPDCYHEFFDQSTSEFVNYQIDTTDLMCSRAGNFNHRMYSQLEAAYKK